MKYLYLTCLTIFLMNSTTIASEQDKKNSNETIFLLKDLLHAKNSCNSLIAKAKKDAQKELSLNLSERHINEIISLCRLSVVVKNKWRLDNSIETLENRVKALKILSLCDKIKPNDPITLMYIARYKLYEGCDLSEVKDLCRRSISLKKENPHSYHMLGLILNNTEKKYDEANKILMKFVNYSGYYDRHLYSGRMTEYWELVKAIRKNSPKKDKEVQPNTGKGAGKMVE